MGLRRLAPLVALSFLLLCSVFFYMARMSRFSEETLPMLFPGPEFSLTNSEGQLVSNEDLRGKVWVADFIFTRCGGPCPLMTQKMVELQQALEEHFSEHMSQIRLVSITVDPAYDKPEVLREYAALWGADLSSWHFLTGPADETMRIIREGFKVSASQEGSGSEDIPSMVHSTNFLLLDGAGFVRAVHHMEDPEFKDSILHNVGRLIEEL